MVIHEESSRVAGAANVTDIAGLAKILDPGLHVVTWHRPVDPAIERLLKSRAWSLSHESRLELRRSDASFERSVAALVPEAAAQSDAAGASALRQDIRRLCEAYSELVGDEVLTIALEEEDTTTCPRFHVDMVGVRMLVTYTGPGTEWLPNEDADRRWLGVAGMHRDTDGVIGPGARIQRAPSFAVILLKGEAWPEGVGFGAIHRSPDLEGETRVLLRVDAGLARARRASDADAPDLTP